MEPFLVIGLAAVLLGFFWWWRRNQAPAPVEDEWVFPGSEGTPRVPPSGAQPGGPEVLNRETLLHRDRTLDPSKWDNSPDELVGTEPVDPQVEASDAPAEAPQVIDRDFLEQLRKREPGSP